MSFSNIVVSKAKQPTPQAPTLMPTSLVCRITGINVSQANALRRTLLDELPTRGLTADVMRIKKQLNLTDFNESVETQAVTPILKELVKTRVELIPIDQSIPVGTMYTLNERATNEIRIVSSSLFKQEKTNKPLHTHDDCWIILEPLDSISVKAMVIELPGYEVGGHVACINVTCLPIDHDPANTMLDIHTVSTWALSMTTNGNLDPRALLKQAVANLAERLKIAKNIALESLHSTGKGHVIRVDKETYSIQGMIMTYICLAHKEFMIIPRIVTEPRSFTIEIEVINEGEARAIFAEAFDANIKLFESFRGL